MCASKVWHYTVGLEQRDTNGMECVLYGRTGTERHEWYGMCAVSIPCLIGPFGEVHVVVYGVALLLHVTVMV